MQKIFIYSCWCINCYNIVKIIPLHQEVYGIIIETKLMILMIMLQMVNHLNRKQKVGKTP